MSYDWAIRCVDCYEKHSFEDMNHEECASCEAWHPCRMPEAKEEPHR